MKISRRIVSMLIIIGICAAAVFYGVRHTRPARVVYVSSEQNISDVVAVNLPDTDASLLAWWKNNRDALRTNFNIPRPDSADGSWTIVFWNYGDGFKASNEHESPFLNPFYKETYCFDSIKSDRNCIDKDIAMMVSQSTNGAVFITTANGHYHIDRDGERIPLHK